MLKKYEPKDYPNLNITIYENIEHISILNSWHETCLQNINWVEGEIKIFGKIHKIPRLQAWYSDHGINYSYSGKVLDQNIWNKELLEIKILIESVCKCTFNLPVLYWVFNIQDLTT
mgnify:CR=1 FL=1